MKKMLYYILIFTIPILLSGCWDYTPLEQSLTVTGIGIDIDKDSPDKILVTFSGPGQSKNSSSSSSTGATSGNAQDSYSCLKASGDSITSAFADAQNKTNQVLAINNVKILVFSEAIARRGINKYLDSFLRNAQVFPNIMIFVTNSSAQELLSFKSESISKIPLYLMDLVNSSDYSIKKDYFTLKQVTYALYSDYKGFVLPYITLNTNEKELKWEKLSLFKEDKMVNVLPESEMLGYLILAGILKSENFVLDSHHSEGIKNDGSSFYLGVDYRKISVSMVNQQFAFDIKLNFKGNTTEMIPHTTMMNGEQANTANDSDSYKKKYEQVIAELVKQNIYQVLEKLQKDYQVDSIGFGEYVRVKYPDYFENVSWQDEFQNAKFNVDIQVNIGKQGIIKLE